MDFEIGNSIKVINTGQLYSSYLDMAKLLGADIDGRWKKRSVDQGDAINNEKGRILNISNSNYHILIQLFDGGTQWIINPHGLKKIDFNYLPEELFEV